MAARAHANKSLESRSTFPCDSIIPTLDGSRVEKRDWPASRINGDSAGSWMRFLFHRARYNTEYLAFHTRCWLTISRGSSIPRFPLIRPIERRSRDEILIPTLIGSLKHTDGRINRWSHDTGKGSRVLRPASPITAPRTFYSCLQLPVLIFLPLMNAIFSNGLSKYRASPNFQI